jgi:putative protein kinase ArgK-like GTPase of G3E family
VGTAEVLDAIRRHRAVLTDAGALESRRRVRRRAELERLLVEELTDQIMTLARTLPRP